VNQQRALEECVAPKIAAGDTTCQTWSEAWLDPTSFSEPEYVSAILVSDPFTCDGVQSQVCSSGILSGCCESEALDYVTCSFQASAPWESCDKPTLATYCGGPPEGDDNSSHDMGGMEDVHDGHEHGMDHEHELMDNADSSVMAYCVKACSTTNEDPCGNGKGQSSACTDVSLELPAAFGFDPSDPPSSFLGCTNDVCADECAAMETTALADIQGDTVCFPVKDTMDGMFPTKDDAELAAVARGCVGSHSMGNMGVMIGSTHTACESSFTKEGVRLGSSAAPSASSVSPVLVAVMTGVGTMIAML